MQPQSIGVETPAPCAPSREPITGEFLAFHRPLHVVLG